MGAGLGMSENNSKKLQCYKESQTFSSTITGGRNNSYNENNFFRKKKISDKEVIDNWREKSMFRKSLKPKANDYKLKIPVRI